MPLTLPRVALLPFALVLMFSCSRIDVQPNPGLKKSLNIVDSLYLIGQKDTAARLLVSIRDKLNPADPLITTYYCLSAEFNRKSYSEMKQYADSAYAYFNTDQRIKLYPDYYYKTLFVNGITAVEGKQYNKALDFYYKAQNVPLNNCDDGSISSRIAGIYFMQKNYPLAIRYLLITNKKLQACKSNLSAQKFFYLIQSNINSTALAYERQGYTDSAMYYYKKDVDFIDKHSRAGFDKLLINPPLVVVYDNLGGLYLKMGNLNMAKKYLVDCLNIPVPDVDGLRLPPLNKLAELYLKTSDYARADSALKEVRRLLDRFGKDNPLSEIKWNRLYAQYYHQLNQPDKAFNFQNTYVNFKDSIENNLLTIYRLDVSRELDAMNQEKVMENLRHQDKLKQLYIACITLAVAMAIALIVLINRNLRISRKSQHETSATNKQLKQTLAELERANKNYIRIMRVMAHDLRNPLSGITGLAAMLLGEDEFNEDSRHMLQLIESTGLHSIEMINELLKTGLADENEQLETQEVDLSALLEDSVELLQFKASEKQQKIIFDPQITPLNTRVNYEKIWRVFNNLIVNAIKFSHAGSAIKVGIGLTPDKQYIRASITDSGIGISDKNKDSIFEMFTAAKRVGTAGEQPFGLGLSISKRIIEKHNGKIWFESTQDVGTTFYVELPVISL